MGKRVSDKNPSIGQQAAEVAAYQAVYAGNPFTCNGVTKYGQARCHMGQFDNGHNGPHRGRNPRTDMVVEFGKHRA